jgi:preprotein translocase subunit YajC
MLIAQSSGDAASGAFNLLFIVVIFGGLFLFMSLRQRRRLRERNAFLATLAVGDTVRTYGGVLGKVEELTDDEVVLTSEDARLRVVRAAVAARVGPE